MGFRNAMPYIAITIGCSFPFGYHTGVMNIPFSVIENFTINVIKERQWNCDENCIRLIMTTCVASFLIGGFFGGITGGYFANRYGRKISLLLLSIPVLLGSLLVSIPTVTKSFEVLIAGRLVIGFACGATSVIGPTFLAEISPVSRRGSAGVLYQVVLLIGILFSQILGLPQLFGTEELWPVLLGTIYFLLCYLAGFCALPCVLHMAMILMCPESPTFLYISKQDPESAKEALFTLRSRSYDVEEELSLLQKEFEASLIEKHSICDLFRLPYLRWSLFLAVIPHIGQQLSSVNGILYYSNSIFKTNGLTPDQSNYANLGIGITINVAAWLSVLLIDTKGRRFLLLLGFSTSLICLILFTIVLTIKNHTGSNWLTYIAIAMIYLFMFSFSMGPGSIPWFIVVELFTQENRDAAVSLCAASNWFCNILVSLVFPELIARIQIYAFVPFIIILFIVIMLIGLFLPETKGRTVISTENYFKTHIGSIVICRNNSNYQEIIESPSVSHFESTSDEWQSHSRLPEII